MGWYPTASGNTGPVLENRFTCCHINCVSTIFRNPLGPAILSHVLRDVKCFNLLQYTHHLWLYALNSSIDISALDIEPGLVVFIVVEKLTPVHFIELLSQQIMHLLAIRSQLSHWVFIISIFCRAVILFRVYWVPRPMPKQLIDHYQFGLLTVYNHKDKKKKSHKNWSHFCSNIFNSL